MLSQSYDVIVVGAGPAGASAAYWLGEAGQRVLVLEKEQVPRYKSCGGGIPKVVFERFPFGFAMVIERWARRVRFRFRDGREVTADLPDRAVAMIMRDRFDSSGCGGGGGPGAPSKLRPRSATACWRSMSTRRCSFSARRKGAISGSSPRQTTFP